LKYLQQLLQEEDGPRIRLDRAALDLATIQFPELEAEPFLDRLNELASRLGDRLRNFNDGRDFIEKAQKYLFEDLGFHGNQTDYFDPLNSCLNQVLERRTGIPVSLSVLYMEVARRLAMPVYGIGLPRHFIIQVDDGNFAAYIDPYHGGRAITPRECLLLAGGGAPDSAVVPAMLPTMLRRVSKKDIIMRMLRNIQRDYLNRKDWPRAVETLDLLIQGTGPGEPDLPPAHKLRGLLRMELHRYGAARADLETYLKMSPQAADREEIVKQIEAIHRRLGQLN
jgi:regulator of sirC expression with transglutaminase-like and TPR domain